MTGYRKFLLAVIVIAALLVNGALHLGVDVTYIFAAAGIFAAPEAIADVTQRVRQSGNVPEPITTPTDDDRTSNFPPTGGLNVQV